MDNKFVLSQSFNEIVFEKRNKKYGAYDIRRKYGRYAAIAGAAAVFFFTCASLTWAYVSTPEDNRTYAMYEIDVTPPVIKPVEDIKPKEEVKQEQPKEQTSTAAEKGPNTPDITSNIEIKNEVNTNPVSTELAGMDSLGVKGGIGSGPQADTLVIAKTPFVPPAPVTWCAFPPTCDELDQHLTSNIRYPQACKEMGIEGTVYIEFIVDTKGEYRDVHVLKGPHPALNAEALRVMNIMPKWTPAKDDNGNTVEFIMRKPIRFQLQ